MPEFRSEIAALTPYEVGRPIEDVARELGLDPNSIIRLTSNESPDGPFPGVIEAATAVLVGSNRYPDPDVWDLSHGLADHLGVSRENLLFGAGSTALVAEIALALGGAGTSLVYPWPSFIMYRFAATWAASRAVEVPLDDQYRLDLDAMAGAIDDSTRLVFVCNPNNPTGTVREAAAVEDFVRSVPDSVLVVVDEAYYDFVTDPAYGTAIPLAIELPNVVVLRTFSKAYALASHRIGYAVGPETILQEIRKAQSPLTVNQVAQAAALASLGQPEEMERRVAANAAGRHHLLGVMAERGLDHASSQTNFIYFKMPGDDSKAVGDDFSRRGVIIRPMSKGWMRVTVGRSDENEKFVRVLDELLDTASE